MSHTEPAFPLKACGCPPDMAEPDCAPCNAEIDRLRDMEARFTARFDGLLAEVRAAERAEPLNAGHWVRAGAMEVRLG